MDNYRSHPATVALAITAPLAIILLIYAVIGSQQGPRPVDAVNMDRPQLQASIPALDPVALNSTIHINIVPGLYTGYSWALLTVWEVRTAPWGTSEVRVPNLTLQQSKITSSSALSIQANGLRPATTYRLTMRGMRADYSLGPEDVITATTLATQVAPLASTAFYDNLGGPSGDLNRNYFDVRTSEGVRQRPTDVAQIDKFIAFAAENHFHTQMIGSLQRGELYIRGRVPMDLSGTVTRTFQTEMDFSPTHHKEGKWPEIHLVSAASIPWSAEEFSSGGANNLLNSVEFSAHGDRGGDTSNFPMIQTNIGGVQRTVIGAVPVFSPLNIRLPVRISISRLGAEMYINGYLAVSTRFSAPLPFNTGYWLLAHRTWYSARDHVTAPEASQVVHWDDFIFDGPVGSYNPEVYTAYQSRCPGVTRNTHTGIDGCQSFSLNPGHPVQGIPLQIAQQTAQGLSAIPATQFGSAILRWNGSSSNGQIALRVNGSPPITVTMLTCCQLDALNSAVIPVALLHSGLNNVTLVLVGSGDAVFSDVQLEVLSTRHRTLDTALPGTQLSNVAATAQNFRLDPRIPGVYTVTTYLYASGGLPSAVTVGVIGGSKWLTFTGPTAFSLQPVAAGGGLYRLNMRINTVGLVADDDAEVGVIEVHGGDAHLEIAVMVTTQGVVPIFRTTFSPLTTNYNRVP